MRVLFLDFDGVLNSESWMLAHPQANFLRALDRSAVALLAEIVSRTQARIVVSSSWRRMYSLNALREVLVEGGLPRRERAGENPRRRGTTHRSRGRRKRGGPCPRTRRR